MTENGENAPLDTNGHPDLRKLAEDAFIWGLTLVIMGRYLPIHERADAPLNQLFITTELAIPEFRQIGPNIDTLMGHAMVDLSDGPMVLGVPEAHGRYYSIQLQDMYMNSFDYIGRRTTGTGPGHFVLTPPGYDGPLPDDTTAIEAPTRIVLAYIRTMLRDEDDLDACMEVHSNYTLGPLSAFPEERGRPQPRRDRARLFPHIDFSKPDPHFFDDLDRYVREFPPASWDEPNLARFAPLGIGSGGPKSLGIDPEILAKAVPAGYARVKQALNLTWTGMWARRDNVTAFVKDPLQRAANNLFGKGTHRSDEAVYWGSRQGAMGGWLDGRKPHRIRFPADGLPPVDAFWSLTLYDKDYVLFDNPLDRYGILDRTRGLRYGEDGSLEILIQADEPEEGPSNWLPAPRAEFQLSLRTYEPRAEIIEGDYVPPQVEPIE